MSKTQGNEATNFIVYGQNMKSTSKLGHTDQVKQTHRRQSTGV
jgi:hypothetical protein